MTENSFYKKVSDFLLNSASIKLIVIFFLLILLLIPVMEIKDLIRERQYRQKAVVNEIFSKWSNEQMIAGPIISVPYKKSSKDDKGNVKVEIKYLHFLPEKLQIKGKIVPEKRYRGIYAAVVYNAQLDLTGHFKPLSLKELGVEKVNVDFSKARLTIGISDLRGVDGKITATINQTALKMNPGVPDFISSAVKSGISAETSLPADAAGFDLTFSAKLKGSKSLYFVPLGEETSVEIASPWTSPSFSGAFLPTDRNVGPNGFTAKWNVSYFNRNYPQSWKGDKPLFGEEREFRSDDSDEDGGFSNKEYDTRNFTGSSFGVKLYTPVTVYQKSTRVTKYALLFMTLTFAAFFFSEILSRQKNVLMIHPIQYLLVGLSLTVFYSLLLSLSEHLRFIWAYLASALSVVLLITGYSLSVLKSKKLSAMVFLLLSFLYGYFYVVLQSEDYALLLGNGLLLGTLAVIMYLTRKINWYSSPSKSDP